MLAFVDNKLRPLVSSVTPTIATGASAVLVLAFWVAGLVNSGLNHLLGWVAWGSFIAALFLGVWAAVTKSSGRGKLAGALLVLAALATLVKWFSTAVGWVLTPLLVVSFLLLLASVVWAIVSWWQKRS